MFVVAIANLYDVEEASSQSEFDLCYNFLGAASQLKKDETMSWESIDGDAIPKESDDTSSESAS